MATFGEQIQALTGFPAETGTTNLINDETGRTLANTWLTEGTKEIINLLPPNLKEKCMTITNLYIDNVNTTFNMNDASQVMHVTRKNADSGYFVPCRKVSAMNGDLTNDSSNIMHYATATDPAHWIESNSSDVATLFVKPIPTALQPAKVYHISYPTISYALGSISNFPNEAEYLFVLYAAIKAIEYLMLTEEDQEVYAPQLATLKQDYGQGITILKGGKK